MKNSELIQSLDRALFTFNEKTITVKSPKKVKTDPSLKKTGKIIFIQESSEGQIKKHPGLEGLSEWQRELLVGSPQAVTLITAPEGPRVFVRPKYFLSFPQRSHAHLLAPTLEVRYRELAGSAFQQLKAFGLKTLALQFDKENKTLIEAALVGINLARYSFTATFKNQDPIALELHCESSQAKGALKKSSDLSQAVNLARHFVNLPANLLNPDSYVSLLKYLFKKEKGVQVEVWSGEKLIKERMNLLLAVGSGAEFGPHLVHLKYRPKKASRKKPVAFVGKGITFDSGGLDIKPASGMRSMKKDMGGSATVAALAYWCQLSGYPHPVDFYLALAENAISAKSFRPGDLLTSRNGLKVEIHNTDAEGRLVLADALDVATSQKEEVEYVIDVATLTGAIKVGLGAEIAGAFSNEDSLLDRFMKSAAARGEWAWPMPLFQRYRSSMASKVADMTNSVDGFGGAVTAALFLESFVKNKKWMHLDIYAWKDQAEGSLAEPGANGQMVQSLVHFLES